MVDLRQGDCMELIRSLPDNSVDLVLTDPPYNIGLESVKRGKRIAHEWDKIDGYTDWTVAWLQECERVLTDNGVLYFWHNDVPQIAQLLQAIKAQTDFKFLQFCIWDKGPTYRAQSWEARTADGATALRTWFNRCEYVLHFCRGETDKPGDTGLSRILSNPSLFAPLKTWYTAERDRLGLTDKDIGQAYTRGTGLKPYMLRHYFKSSQFAIPTEAVWSAVYEPLGFVVPFPPGGYEGLRQEYEGLRQEYEGLRQEYEGLRYYHKCDAMHCNVWQVPPVPSTGRLHPCQKPVALLERLCKVSCRPGGTVLDLFAGSGSTGVACVNTGRSFIGFERDPEYFAIAQRRIAEAQTQKEFEDDQIRIGGI